MKRKILSLLLMFTAIVVGAETFTVNGITYETTGGNTVMVKSYSVRYDGSDHWDVRIPSVVTRGTVNYSVTSIGDGAFNGIHIKSVSIPASVEYVSNNAFNFNDSLKSIRIEDGDTPISLYDYSYATFDNAGARYTVYVGRNIERVYNKSLPPYPQATSITWGPKVTAIGDGEGCSQYLIKAVIGNSVKTIGSSAFEGSGNASNSVDFSVTMGANVESIGNRAFCNCIKLTSIEIPKVLKAIPDYCFNSTRIKDIVIPASVMSVGNAAFNFNDSIKTVTIEDSEEKITFYDYEYATFDNAGGRYTVYQGRNVEREYNKSLPPYPQATSIIWGPKVTAIGNGEGCSPYLIKAVIGNSVKTIGSSAFEGSGNASNSKEFSVTMGANVESIGIRAFCNCIKLTSIELPKVLKAIPDYCFNSTRIKDIVIPASVMSVGNAAFNYNDSIKTVTIEDSEESITFNDYEYGNFDNAGGRYTVYQGRNVERMYNKSLPPYPQATSITWGPKVTVIGDNEGCSPYLQQAVIGNSVKSVGSEAFYGAGNGSNSKELFIAMGANVESIGIRAFCSCTKLTSIELPKVLKEIPDYCFNSTRIKDIVIPASVMSVGNAAFNYNDSIKTVTIEDSDESITFNDYEYGNFDNVGSRYTVYQGRNIERMYNKSLSPFPQAVNVAFGVKVSAIGSGMYNSPYIVSIIAPWERPISINSDVFNSELYGKAILYVPRKCLSAYKVANVWKEFLKVEEMEETKCFTPTARLDENGRLHFECETKDVTFHYKYTYPEGREGTGNDIAIGQTLYLTLYASKAGLEDSDKAVYELGISGGGSAGIRGDVNGDKQVGMPDVMFIVNYILKGKFPDE